MSLVIYDNRLPSGTNSYFTESRFAAAEELAKSLILKYAIFNLENLASGVTSTFEIIIPDSPHNGKKISWISFENLHESLKSKFAVLRSSWVQILLYLIKSAI